MEGTNRSVAHFIETQAVSRFCGHGADGKKGGPKMKVSLTMLLKTNVEKMSVCALETMLLKTS
jgi:hypothetical protein